MLTFRERAMIKKMVKRFDCKHLHKSIVATFKTFKLHDVEQLRNNMKLVYDERVKVRDIQAYNDLIQSHKNMLEVSELVHNQQPIYMNGVKIEPGRVWDFEHCFSDVSCYQCQDAIRAYDMIEREFDDCSKEEKIAMLALSCVFISRISHVFEDDGNAWSVTAKAKTIREAEEKYGKTFFVNEWVYDTFLHPELFECYGVYKIKTQGRCYCFRKENIVQDVL